MVLLGIAIGISLIGAQAHILGSKVLRGREGTPPGSRGSTLTEVCGHVTLTLHMREITSITIRKTGVDRSN